jgi:hypothetical protein
MEHFLLLQDHKENILENIIIRSVVKGSIILFAVLFAVNAVNIISKFL